MFRGFCLSQIGCFPYNIVLKFERIVIFLVHGRHALILGQILTRFCADVGQILTRFGQNVEKYSCTVLLGRRNTVSHYFFHPNTSGS